MIRLRSVLVPLVALLVVSSMPVAAQNASAVASQHTTFGTGSQGEPAPTTLTKTTVQGSGDSASVRLGAVVNSYEDGVPPGYQQVTALSGMDGDFAAQQSDSDGGPTTATAADFGGSISETETVSVLAASNQSRDAHVALSPDSSSGIQTTGPGLVFGRDNTFEFFSGGSNVDTGVSYQDNAVYRIVFSDINVTSDTYDISIVSVSDGQTVLTRDGQGFRTDVDSLQYLQTWYDDSRSGYITVDSVERLADSGVYIGAPHDAEEITEGWTNLTLSDASATVTWQADSDHDGSWTNVTSTTVSTTTNVSQDLTSIDSDRWRVRVDIEATGPDPVVEIHDEGVLFDSSSPSLADPSPSGQIETFSGNISVNISDSDFGLAQGDSVSIEATNSSGEVIGSQTVSSSGTVAFSYAAKPGSNEIIWTATDSYGNSESLSQSFTTPATLEIRNESDPSQLITDANVTVRFYFRTANPQVITRNSTDGKIDMSGLPGDEPFVVVAQLDGFNTRRILVPSYYNQSTIYLLPENKTATDTVFSIQDYTGEFSQESTALLVQRGLNGSWETVTGDYFGATGEFPAQLRYQVRHRLVLVNLDTGDRRVVGSYTPLTASQQTVRVTTQGEIDVVGRGLDIAIGPSTRTLTDTANEKVSITIDGEDAAFTNATLRAVYHDSNRSSTTILANQTVTETGEHSLSVNLSGRSGGSLEVVVDYETDSVSTSEHVRFAIRRAFENEHSLLSVLGTVAPRFPEGHVDAFQSIVVLVSTVIAATVTAKQPRVSSELVGGVVILVLAGWAVIGWVGYGVVFVAGTAYVSLGAIRRGL